MFKPTVYEDDRGFFSEAYSSKRDEGVEQVNVSFSKKGVVRGLHFQKPYVTKRTWVLKGKLYAVAYNPKTEEKREKMLTPNSGTFICPKGWANGNQAMEDTVFAYTMDGLYNADGDKAINPLILDWQMEPILSDKDKNAPRSL